MKTLVRHGNSLALIIDKPILELLKIEEKTPLDLVTDGDMLVVKPVRDAKRAREIRAIHERINKQYASTFKRLAE